jgi:hypothetical protein
MNWSNRKPEEGGHYWLVEKKFEDGVLMKVFGPSLVYITISIKKDKSKHLGVDYLGSDDPGGLPTTDDLIIERSYPRDSIFGFDNEETTKKKAKDIVKGRWEYWIKPQRIPSFESDEIEDYPVLHQSGMLSVETPMKNGNHFGDVGVQIAKDGRIWICFDGCSFIRFKPLTDKQRSHYEGR